MKITKNTNNISKEKQNRTIANIGCNTCPSCGEDRKDIECIRQGNPSKGISNMICKTYADGIFKMKSLKIDCYSCWTCGTQWESEPYEYIVEDTPKQRMSLLEFIVDKIYFQ